MNHPEEAPKLSKLPFIAADLALIAAAVVIALRSATPITPGPLLAITICVVAGAALLVVPFLANYARRQDAELTERQNQIAALARITSDSAEQLSIVAAGLNGIAESSKHNITAIEKLPAKLQERIDGLTQQFAGSALSAHSSVKEDVARLEATAEKITRTLAKLDIAAKAKGDTLADIEKELAASLARATAQLEAFAAATLLASEKLALPPAPAATNKPGRTKSTPAPIHVAPSEPAEPVTPVTPNEAVTPPPAAEEPASAPVEPAIVVRDIPSEPASTEPEPVVEETPVSTSAAAPAEFTQTAAEPVAVVVEPTPEPAPAQQADEDVFTASEPEAADVPVSEPEAPKAPRSRKARADDSGFDLGLTSDAQETTESAITSDGFTRLIATAYIGIGNKLFIRGEGPGLSWEKGVALQFVSIGKWRWETPDATAPITAKLYKNDQVECLGLGSLTLEPGRQHEVNAGF